MGRSGGRAAAVPMRPDTCASWSHPHRAASFPRAEARGPAWTASKNPGAWGWGRKGALVPAASAQGTRAAPPRRHLLLAGLEEDLKDEPDTG